MAFWDKIKKASEDQNTNITPLLIGSDLGYGQIKTASGDTKKKFLSAVGIPVSNFGRSAAVTSEKELLSSLTVTMDNQTYYVGHNAIVNTRNGRLTLRQNKADDVHNKIKFLTSLALYMEEDQNYGEFDIVTGLPVLEYRNQKDQLEQMMSNNGRIFFFEMHYGPKVVSKQIKINNVKVISQGEGCFYDFILDDNGQIIPEKVNIVSGTVMVVDIGYRTSDIVTMENGRYIEPLSDQLNKGVNTIHQEILRLIMEKYGIKKELKDLDQFVRDGKFYHNTRDYDIRDIIKDAARPFAEDIVESLHTISNDQLGSVNHVIFTGGGASIIYEHIIPLLNSIVETSIMDDSEFCNASGYYKYGLLLQNAQKEIDNA
ncbi:partition protein [Bacillus phage G]|uniref:Gp506 n=1 Tax=Bacillus phage G TaxID=2884420 RepID=G3MAP7_9CAUD|nr:partition protein [Bacillus phage G]AEO93764.1 gp506 [Bacillus phage G]